MASRRFRKPWSASLGLVLGLTGLAALAQMPGPSPLVPGPTPPVHRHKVAKRGPIHHLGFVIHDRFIGDPELFKVPPLGYSLSRTMGAQTAKANLHTYMLYRSDFIAGTDQLSPTGLNRLGYMATHLKSWSGPIVIEWTPHEPGLAEARRARVLSTLAGTNVAILDDRAVIGPSPYPGLLGADAANNYDTLIIRDVAAPLPQNFPLPPNSTTTMFSESAR